MGAPASRGAVGWVIEVYPRTNPGTERMWPLSFRTQAGWPVAGATTSGREPASAESTMALTMYTVPGTGSGRSMTVPNLCSKTATPSKRSGWVHSDEQNPESRASMQAEPEPAEMIHSCVVFSKLEATRVMIPDGSNTGPSVIEIAWGVQFTITIFMGSSFVESMG